jgi:serine/threonine-protein kinase
MTEGSEIEVEGEPPAKEPLLASGTVIDGKYSIQRSLGRGGTGTVYEARHAAIGHRVALKIVNADRAQRPETLARFEREAQICGAIRHPNVGQIYDVGTHEGKPYMVLELHEGQSLADVLDESVLPVPAILEITLQVLSALAAIHDARVVHRDVKPDNVMLVRALNGDIVVKLVDFGISKMVTTDIRDRTVTREGSILGSPDYMAPEQLRGQEVDARTDLYAAGVLLYQAVTGYTPFDAENLSDLMVAILRDPVVPARELRADCPPELDALIMKALSRNPEDRFQSAVEMARELEQLRSVARMSVPPGGLTDSRKPRPARSDRVTSERRAKRKRAADVATSAPPAPAEAAPTEAAPTEQASTSGARRGVTAAVAFAVVAALAMLLALVLRDAEGVVAAPITEPSPSTPPPTTTEPALPAQKLELAPAAAAPVLDAGVRVARDETAEPVERSPKTKQERRPKSEREPALNVREQLAAASAAFVRGQMPLAKTLYQKILERAPSQPEALRGLGLVSSRMGQEKDAARAFERYLELRPDAPDAARIREQLEKLR